MIAIIKYNAGNSTSVMHAVERLGFECVITADQNEIRAASHVILPGVGHANSAMQYLKETGLDELIVSLKQPVLGICLGQQLLCDYSEEGDTACLGVFEVPVKIFPSTGIIPHTGWNNLISCSGPLFNDLSGDEDLYFVHSYYVEKCEYTIATCEYLIPFSAAMQKDNFYATQFHPEKSSVTGEKILNNFLKL